MMIAMQYVGKFLYAGIITDPVKNKTMCYVFKKGPEEYSSGKNKRHAGYTI